MSNITKIIGERLRAKRMEHGWSQEYTAEKAGLHPTYIGQLERGEKNATLESVEKICIALQYPMEHLFVHIVTTNFEDPVASECYQIICQQSLQDQKKLLFILKKIIEYKY
ncbi:hypothetical protein BHF69_03660 [Anaerostipes sp. 992a]|uniref:helix-turn-helix domain-containing protein n=1 Tax=Anaerostipes sp. 992a TaxID=1261637 RepID=UPI0009517E1D|nr:helix-turn-helix transcriptional regulator [Anaerostipes sp. 992a]OLR63927.1 hypothetical protein BHF69_03660 [Anaerostipes sp. 992a]